MPVQIRLLGQPQVVSPTEAVLPLGKPFALLVYLLDHGPTSRDHLAELLWPTSDRSKGRASVRQALWLLRQRLGDEIFDGDEPVAIATDAIQTDLSSLLAVLDNPPVDPEQLTPLLGEPLAGLTVPDAPAWRHWAEDFRSRTAHRVGSRLVALAEDEPLTGQPARAVDLLRLALRIQPERVETHLALVAQLLDARGLEEAESQIDAVRRLDDPDATRKLGPWEERLRALRMSRVPTGRPEIHLDFVGRSRETAALLGTLRRAASGHGQVGLITGPAGIGKTRLIDEVALAGQLEGARVARAKAHETERNTRFGALIDLLRDLLALPGSAGISAASDEVLRGFVPSLNLAGEPRGRPSPSVLLASLADAFIDLVDAVSSESPLLLILDDLHWADEGTRTVLTRTAHRISGAACLVIVTSRDSPDPSLNRSLRALGRVAAQPYALAPLTGPDTEELLGMLAEFDSAGGLRDLAGKLHAVSDGNPLFLLETLKTLRERHLLEPAEDGRWRFLKFDPNSLSLPPTLRETLLGRIEQLPEDLRPVAERLARAGRPMSPDSLIPRDRMGKQLAGLLDLGLVGWTTSGKAIDFIHDELRQAVRSHTSRPRRGVGYAAVAAVVLLGLAVGSVATQAKQDANNTNASPYGGGAIWAFDRGAHRVYRATGTPPRWIESRVPDGSPETRHLRPFRTAPNSLMWIGQRIDLEAAPDAIWRRSDGSTALLMARTSDDVGAGVSPDGRTALVYSDDPKSPTYAQDLWLAPLDGTPPQLLRARSNRAHWSTSGLRILTSSFGPPDTVRALRPDGSIAVETTWTDLANAVWCGVHRFAVLQGGVGPPRLFLVDDRGQAEEYELEVAKGTGHITCSPDGSAIAHQAIRDGVVRTVVRDLATSEEFETELDSPTWMRWIPDSIPPVPEAVSLEPDTIEVAWGAEAQVSATVMFTDGEERHFAVEWTSVDDNIATVSAGGLVAANGIGSTQVIASVAGWHRDTATVIVRGSDEPRTLLQDSLTRLDRATWHLVGSPPPRVIVHGTAPVLHLAGDGRYTDGMITKNRLTGETGMTVEAQFRMPVTRVDRQRFDMCVTDAEPPVAVSDPTDWSAWIQQDYWCIKYPAGELSRFDSGQLVIQTASTRSVFDVSDVLPTEDWTHVALQVRPDGYASLFLNYGHVATSQVRIPDFSQRSWRVLLAGASVDTNLLIKHLVVWPKARYR